MAHKKKNRTNDVDQSIAATIADQPILEKTPKDLPAAPLSGGGKHEQGLSWQPLVVLTAMAIGLLVVLGKILGLF